MAATWITIAASSLPEIIRLARPLFTRAPPIDTNQIQRLAIIDEQIAELQATATLNADSITRLATDMQKTLDVLHVGAERMQRQLHRANRLATIATTIAALAFATAIYALGQ